MHEPIENDSDGRKMSNIKSEYSFEDFYQKCSDSGCDNSRFGVNFYFRNKFVERKKDQKCQHERKKILNEKVVHKRDYFRIDIIGYERTFLYRAMEGRPYGCDRQGDQHDDTDDEHDQILHQSVVKKGFFVVGFEYEIDRINQVREQKTGGDKRTCQSKPSQVGDILGKLLYSLEEVRIQLSEEFFRKNIETANSDFRTAQDFCGCVGEKGCQRNRAHERKVGDRDGKISASIALKLLHNGLDDIEDRKFHWPLRLGDYLKK